MRGLSFDYATAFTPISQVLIFPGMLAVKAMYLPSWRRSLFRRSAGCTFSQIIQQGCTGGHHVGAHEAGNLFAIPPQYLLHQDLMLLV